MSGFLLAGLVWAACAMVTTAQELGGLARIDAAKSTVRDDGRGARVELHLSQPIPYRVFTLDEPPRLVLDFREVNWDGVARDDLLDSTAVTDLRFGQFRPGWSRMVLDMAGPLGLQSAEMRVDDTAGTAVVSVRLVPVSAMAFADSSGAPEAGSWALRPRINLPPPDTRQSGDRPLRVVIDPGHGGIDPGAERGGVRESDLMLTFGRELREALRRSGMEVVMTRDSDVFVPLETRVTIARQFDADVFLSLHADALAEGGATGATVYTLSDSASDEATAALVERHNRADLVAGLDLSRQDDVVAGVLMDLARIETAPRARRLAQTVIAGFHVSGVRLNRRSKRAGGFSVLKAPDIPSVLIELGFLSSARDRAELQDPAIRAQMATAVRDALLAWAVKDAAEAELLRQ